MTMINLTIRLEDSGSATEPIVGQGWLYRVRNSKPYVNTSGDLVADTWKDGSGWKTIQSATVSLDLDPLPDDNPYLLEIQQPGDPTSASLEERKPRLFRREYRKVGSLTANGTSWWNLPQVTGPGPDAVDVLQVSGYAELLLMIQDLQAQVAGGVSGSGGVTVSNIPEMSTDARTFNKAANFLAMRNALLASGLTTVDDLAVGDDLNVGGDLAITGVLTNAGLTAALDAKAPTSAIPTWTTISGKPAVVGAGADQAAALAAIGAAPLASPALTGNPTAPTPAAGDNDTSIATTAFVQAALSAAGAVSITPDPTNPNILIVTIP